jgi:small multidrug resistance pump
VGYLYLAIAAVSEVIATSALKASNQCTQPLPTLMGLAGYAVAYFFLSLTLRTLPLGVAYAIWAGAGTMLIALLAQIRFQQALDTAAIVGIALMLAGTAIVYIFSNTSRH